MSIALNEEEDLSLIQLAGEIDIATAADLKAMLLKVIERGCDIRVSLEAVSALDVTTFQLLWSAEREAIQAGLGFAVMGALSESVGSSLDCMGLGKLWAGKHAEPAL